MTQCYIFYASMYFSGEPACFFQKCLHDTFMVKIPLCDTFMVKIPLTNVADLISVFVH